MKYLKSLLTACLLLCVATVNAHDFEVDGIYYNIIDNRNSKVAVTYKGGAYSSYSDRYTGGVVIPSHVTYSGKIYSVTSIGNYAFYGCSGLTRIEIPNSVTSIGDYAFSGCSELTSIEIPNSVTSIGYNAFYNCSGLTSVIIGNSVTSIGICAFYNCSGLTSIVIPNSVTSIGDYAFFDCSGLTSIVVEVGNKKYDSRENCNAIIETKSNKLIAGCMNTVIPNSVTSIGDYAFFDCSGLTSIVIPNSVTSIGDDAFRDCSGLTSIIIPNSVTSIGNLAFYNCSGLTSIVIGNSVTSIGNSAFSDCSGLTSIEIPNSVTGIGNNAFERCFGLTSITIPNSVISIGNSAFYGCFGLTSITIPNSVTSIGGRAFYICDNLTSIVIGNSVTSIGEEAFYGTAWYDNQPDGVVYTGNVLYAYKGTMPPNTSVLVKDGTLGIAARAFFDCSGLASIIIPNSVVSIGDGAFSGCSGLTSIEIPNSVTSIEGFAFSGCSGLTSIEIPNSVTSIGEWAFFGTAWYDNQPDGVVYAGNVLYTYKGTMPPNTSVLVKDGTLGIAASAFSGCSGLTSVVIPNSVTSIGDYAFFECSGLTSITIPNSVTSIGSKAFYNCSGLKIVVNLSRLTLRAGSSDYGYIAYYADKVINDPNCSIMGDFVFSTVGGKHTLVAYLGNATEITLPDNYNGEDYTIGDDVFYNCLGLTSIEIPNSVTGIGDYAFYNCKGLTSIVIPNSVTSIGNYAFLGCSGLTNVVIGNSVTSIGIYAFFGTAWYDNQPDGVVYTGNVLYAYKGTMPPNTSVLVKDGTLGIAASAFSGCSGLTSIEIPNSVTSIGVWAFEDCSGLTSVVIPNSVTSIGDRAFSGCSGLTSIVIPNSVTSIGEIAFYNCSGLKIVVNLSRLTLRAGSSDYGYIAYYADKVINDPNCSIMGDFVFSTVGGKHTLVAYLGNATEITLPDNYNGEDYAIGDNLFNGNNTITSIIIPNSVVSIGDGAFSGCSGLKTVVNLSRLTLSAGSTGCGYVAYYADKVINAHNGSIEGDFVFGKPDGASTLVAYLGSEIELVLPVDYGGENYVIGDDVFSHCSELENLTIPCSVTNIGNYAFNGCTSLKELCIEDGEDVLVLGCNDAGKGLFYDCPLEMLYVGRTLSYEKDSLSGYSPFYGIEALASVGIGTSDLDENLFDGCLNINNVGFNAEVAPSIFANYAKVTDVTLSGRVKVVADGAFAGMDKLTNVVLETPVPPAISSAAFEKLHYKMLYVYLLDGCTPIYQASEIWKNFLDIQEFTPDGAGVCEASNVWRNYWDIPEYIIPEGEIEESVLADVPQFERMSDGVRLPNAAGKRISIYTFSGSLVKEVSGYSGETIALDKGTYIIVADNDAMKVVL